MWTRERAQDRADRLAFTDAQPERAIREAAAGVVKGWDGMTWLGDQIVIPFSGREVRVVLPASWGGNRVVLQLVIEEQIREQLYDGTPCPECGGMPS